VFDLEVQREFSQRVLNSPANTDDFVEITELDFNENARENRLQKQTSTQSAQYTEEGFPDFSV
jgi:hypothetical protein